MTKAMGHSLLLLLMDQYIAVCVGLSANTALITEAGERQTSSAHHSATIQSTDLNGRSSVVTAENEDTTLSINMVRESTPVDERDLDNPDDLVIQYMSPNMGVIETPGYDGQTPYPSDMDSWLRVQVSEGHVLLISCPEFPMAPYVGDLVGLYIGSNTRADRVWFSNNYHQYRLQARLYRTREFFLHFTSDGLTRQAEIEAGFRFLFTFHSHTSEPQQLVDGRWNCSVDWFPDFQQHFVCNYEVECQQAEDEQNCSYTDDSCGPGLIAMDGACYLYINPGGAVTWREANTMCLLRGTRLASLATPTDWSRVSAILKRHKTQLRHIFVGLTSTSHTLPSVYRKLMIWSNRVIAYYVELGFTETKTCAFLVSAVYSLPWGYRLSTTACDRSVPAQILCEAESPYTYPASSPTPVTLPIPTSRPSNDTYTECPAGHLTHDFLACDVSSDCWLLADQCRLPVTSPPPSFTCDNGVQRVPYTLVCDHRSDCSDDSDEKFCVFPPCALFTQFDCGDGQCIGQHLQCDGVKHCVNAEDEEHCAESPLVISMVSPPPPAIVDLHDKREVTMRPLNQSSQSAPSTVCPETHFQCPHNGYCLPVYVRCNDVYDCPGKEDEAGCDRSPCAGLYRCRGSSVCLHPHHLCDGTLHCPQHDDELQCNATCPSPCLCYGAAFFCTRTFTASSYLHLRYLHADHTAMTPADVSHNRYLVHLSLSSCSVSGLDNVSLPNLRSLDLSDNRLSVLGAEQFLALPNLRALSVAGNPLLDIFSSSDTPSPPSSFPSVLSLDLSRVWLAELHVPALSVFPSLQALNLSHCDVQRITDHGFRPLPHLRLLDLRGSPVTYFPRDLLLGLDDLDSVYSDNYKLCCPATLPEGFYASRCHAPSDEISSCEALLRSDLYRIFLSVFAFLALCGNLGSFVYRVLVSKTGSKLGFDVFVTHLCVADFVMGLYLAIIGVADRLYQGTYLWDDLTWKGSAACQLAGFLSLLSSEVSALMICLITLDRFLVLRFPFSQHVHFKRRSAQLACAAAWLLGAFIAAVPLMASQWQFYSQTGICIPLPITRKEFAGQGYAFAVMIAFNFLLFVLIAAGQLSIYLSVRANSLAVSDDSKKSQDLTIARRLITIAVSDFLCWFPIGLLGLMAASGSAIRGEVNVAIVIFVLPFNSALNPFLYTLNVLLERRRRQREQRLYKMLLAREQATKTTAVATERTEQHHSKAQASRLLTHWMDSGILSLEQVSEMVHAVQLRSSTERP